MTVFKFEPVMNKKAPPEAVSEPSAACEIIIFPGVRIERHDTPDQSQATNQQKSADLSRCD